MTESIRQLVHNKGVSEELVINIVKEALLAAYKKKFGSNENAYTDVDEENGEVRIFSRKEVVDEVTDELTEISLEEARQINAEAGIELNDEVLIEVRPETFDRIAIQTAKQVVLQNLRNMEKNLIYSEYKTKEGELISGTYQRERYGNIYVDLGRAEGFLPKREQSMRENYRQGDRIRAVILEVRKAERETQIILSRANPIFIKRIFEIEVPEVADKVVQILNISREVGYRTKLAVSSHEIDPVGACVGMKGMRIQNIVKELEGEKIDIVRHSEDAREFIKNSLTPASCEKVLIINEEEKKAIAVVEDSQLMLAIGKGGQNVKLASRLTGWNIDIKTKAQFEEEGYEEEAVKKAKEYFTEIDDRHDLSLLEDEIPESTLKKLEEAGILSIEELLEKNVKDLEQIPGIGPKTAEMIINSINKRWEYTTEEEELHGIELLNEELNEETITALKNAGFNSIETLIDKSAEELQEIEGIDEETANNIIKVISETVEVDVEEIIEEQVYSCPECGAEINESMTSCPKCGIEFEFE